MNRKKITRYVLPAVLLVITTAAIYGYKEFNRKQTDTTELSTAFSLPATDLVKAFESNEKAATPTYVGKVLQVEGTVKEIVTMDHGLYTVVVGDAASMSSVRCAIDSSHGTEMAAINKGSAVAIKGICSGFLADEMLGSDVQLDRCIIAWKK